MAAIEASSPQPEGASDLLQEALVYHAREPAGKLKMMPTKPCATAHDLALAYSPGVAEPCREIAKDPDAAWKYTGRGNLVAVISNGTAVLGLGNIGALAGKPVMEGKSILFQRFAGVNSIDLEIAEENAQKLIDIIRPLEPSFGGINLEDIKAPECFIVEEALKEQMNIPVFHDDQHGTAIVTGAALLNGAHLQGKELCDLHVVCIGAGASAIACMTLWIELGVKKEHITMLDSAGVIREGRTQGSMNEYKARFARPASDSRDSLLDALKGADVVIGLSSGGSIPEEGILSMAEKPIIFALANPDPEIAYERAKELTNGTAVIATGRSDHPNQVNNVLAFPFLFRGALAVRARGITEEMKVATAKAIAELARTPVPADVKEAYGGADMQFGPEYILPKPFDRRLLPWVASRVARIACETGTAQAPITDFEAFEAELTQQAQQLAITFQA